MAALTRTTSRDNDFDDRLQERIKQSDEGLSRPWTPPDPTKDCWGKPIKLRKRKQSSTN